MGWEESGYWGSDYGHRDCFMHGLAAYSEVKSIPFVRGIVHGKRNKEVTVNRRSIPEQKTSVHAISDPEREVNGQ